MNFHFTALGKVPEDTLELPSVELLDFHGLGILDLEGDVLPEQAGEGPLACNPARFPELGQSGQSLGDHFLLENG